MKPFSQACENNKGAILEVLRTAFAASSHVLEIGSGTGQHAVHFARHLPHLIWQTADTPGNHQGIIAWLEESGLDNVRAPLALDVNDDDWGLKACDAVFSANTAHIMHWPEVERMFAGIGRLLTRPGSVALYGPFNYGGEYTSASNAAFDRHLRSGDPGMGIRDFEALDRLAGNQGLELTADRAMPANNRVLVWQSA